MKWATDRSDTHIPASRSILFKQLAGYITITLLVVLLTGLVSFFLIRQQTLTSTLAALQGKAVAMADIIGAPGGMPRMLDYRRLKELQALSDVKLAYIHTDLRVRQLPNIPLLDEDGQDEFVYIDVEATLDKQLLQSLLNGERVTDVRRFDFISDEVAFAGAPVMDEDGQVTGAVLLYRPLRQVSEVTGRITLMLLIAGGVSLIVAIALAFFMGIRLSSPLIEMNRTAKHIADGNYGERVRIISGDEVGQLGATLNHLSERLSVVIQNLNEEKSKLQNVLTSIGEGIIAIDRSGHVTHHNPAALELLELKDWQLFEESHARLIAMMNNSMATGERKSLRFQMQGHTIEAISSPMLDEDQSMFGAVCLLRDISQAERLEQMRKDYIANISHELRTPLTGIRGMVEPLLDGYIETEQEREDCYRIIYQETLRLERLIGEMLDLSRLQDGRIKMELEPMEAVPLLQAAARRLAERAKQGQVSISVEGDDRLRVMGNEDRIMQVLIILIDNALGFTQTGGSVLLRADREQGGKVRLSVRDTGSGIDPKDLPYIWERFFKADRSRLRTQGVGLGLAIAKLIVELMDGQIGVETELGVGSTFWFTLGECE